MERKQVYVYFKRQTDEIKHKKTRTKSRKGNQPERNWISFNNSIK